MYAYGDTDRLIVYAEKIQHDEYEFLKNNSITRKKGMMEINNYYERKLSKNRKIDVVKFEFQFYPYLN